MRFGKTINLLINRSPSENYRRLKAKLSTGTADFLYDPQTVLRSSRHMDARHQLDRLFRYQRVIQNQRDWPDLDFADRAILEIGCGPLLGWGPIAIYLGCSQYVCVEPRFHKDILQSEPIFNRYFLPLHQQLEALFHRGINLDSFRQNLLERSQIHSQPLESSPLPAASIDLILSNGVLQHIMDLEGCFDKMRHVAHAHTQHFHVLNFTDHVSSPEKPFAKIYSRSPQDYFKESSLLNLKRPSEMLALFAARDFAVTLVPYYCHPNVASAVQADYWRQFPPEDLAVEFAFIITP